MSEKLTPKQVARSIGVSESSVKRWCDKGLIETMRTAGGHRRLLQHSVLSFLKERGYPLAEPEVIGLPPAAGKTEWTIDRAQRQLTESLVKGEEEAARQIVFDMLLAGHRLSIVCDQVIAPSFHEIGAEWDCGSVEVYQERRSCEICLRLLHELRLQQQEIPRTAPVAIGGTLDGDMYTVCITMAELVLRENGWNATSLGNSLPFSTLRRAIEQQKPRLFWLSVSYIRDAEVFLREANELFDCAAANGVALAVGGQALTEEIRRQMQYSSFCDTMQHLESFAATQFESRGG